ncbi:unnamed protein product [Adineta steineri]|uniref:Uncharacterized protein n=1 Tax=Adineta steineri TaxID=433720 RepID=A0A818S3N8_9BILA|nr:unnamed protein product [Adineta steineri]CAF3829224.1 unnamed protein product [Adineta steineri]
MTSDDHRNGEYLKKWITCSVPKKYETSLPRSSPRLHINKNGDMARKLQQKINDYGILKRHIILRATDPSFTKCKNRCEGVTLHIRLGNETSPGRIIQATPCRHGINGDDDGFKNSYRKLKIYVQDVINSLAHADYKSYL